MRAAVPRFETTESRALRHPAGAQDGPAQLQGLAEHEFGELAARHPRRQVQRDAQLRAAGVFAQAQGDRVGGLVDFYFACNGSLLYDVAITVNDWCMGPDSRLDEARTRAMLKAYNAARPFAAKEAEMWSMALRVAALRFWISRLYDLHLPRLGELVKPRNPEPFKRILQNHIDTTRPVWL